MRILLVDDHALFLEGLQNLLRAKEMEVVGVAHHGREAIAQAQRLQPDVILMDIQMPECDGIEATRQIKARLPHVQIVMLTMSTDDAHLFEAIKAGATGYLLKNLEVDQFFELLNGLERGEAPMPRDLATKILREFAHQAQTPTPADTEPALDEPTERQLEVLKLIAQGWTNKQVADQLFITERTVKYHLQEILQKLHLRNRTQAVAYAVRTGLINPETITIPCATA